MTVHGLTKNVRGNDQKDKGKGKRRWVSVSTDEEEEEKDELESEELTGDRYRATAITANLREIKKEDMDGDDEALLNVNDKDEEVSDYLDEPSTRPKRRPSGKSRPARKAKREPKSAALIRDTDDDQVVSLDRYAADGENDPACRRCIDRGVTCLYVVDPNITACKDCQRQKAGCSISAQKALALQERGIKRNKRTAGKKVSTPAPKEPRKPRARRYTAGQFKADQKKAGLPMRSKPTEKGESILIFCLLF